MTYRLIVDGNLYSRKGVFNENLFASCINTSAVNGYNDNSALGNSILNIGNHTNTLNMGGFIPNSAIRTTINFNGDVNVNGVFSVNGTFNYPNSFDYLDLTRNVSIGFNQNNGTTINLGNIDKTSLNTNIYGNKTRNAYTANNCIDLNTGTSISNIDFYSNDNNVNFYSARINSTGGNIGSNGTGTLSMYSGILNLPNTINTNSINSIANLFTNQTTGGDIIIGSSSANVSIRGTRLSVPNNISSSTPGTVVNLFTNQTTGGNINIGSNNVDLSLRGTLFLNGFVGQVAFFAITSAPSGWLKCNGTEISRTTYSNLFSIIGTIYGSGNNTTTFNLPDFRGYFLRGLDDGKGIDTGRTLNNTAQIDDNKSHTHTATDSGHSHTATQPAHNHTINDPGHKHNFKLYNDDYNNSAGGTMPGGFSTDGATTLLSINSTNGGWGIQNSTTGITINSAQPAITVDSSTANITVESSGGTETRPKNFALLICIKY